MKYVGNTSAAAGCRSALPGATGRRESAASRPEGRSYDDKIAFRRRSSPRGFTLLELLAAMAILSVLVVMLFSIFSQASRAWLQSENRVETFQNARATLDFMSRELSQTMTTSNLSFLGRDYFISFVAPINTGTNTDLEGVFYIWNASTLTLTRAITNVAACYASTANWPTSITVSNTLAENVVSLTLSYMDSSGNPQTYWNSISPPTGAPNVPPGQPIMANCTPAGVQIKLGIIDSRAAKRLAAVGGVNTAAGRAITNQSTQVFSTFVAIPNGH